MTLQIDEMLKAVVHAGFVPGVPEVIEAALGAPAVEMPIEASKTDPPEVPIGARADTRASPRRP